MSILENINGHSELSTLNEEQRVQLCREIRDFLVSNISKTGGHLASNLGVVELTVAIETVFDTYIDRLVFDVGHQSYVHKLLTGRRAGFSSLRQFEGMAGFPKPSESDADAFTAGHASSSVSVALGMARARSIQNQSYDVVALLGDGAATGGMIYEGLNDAAVSNEPMIVILNDNAMSIDRNVGGMASHLSSLRTKEKYLGMKKKYRNFMNRIPGGRFIFRLTRAVKDRIRRMLIPTTIFESMGFTYFGPVDGHDTENLITLLRIAREMRRPVLLHVITQKGRGYAPAEEHPKLFHGVGKFDPVTGQVQPKSNDTFSDAFGAQMCQLAAENEKVCAITAAMPGGTGLLEYKKAYPSRLFDVGIAEEHAVSMAAGLAKQGMVPVVAIYSTFLQRAYDMILQDICLQRLHVVFAVDRAGLVGEDGETHHGVFDVGYLRQAPGMTLLSPLNTEELQQMLSWAVNYCDGPVAIRYPRGGNGILTQAMWSPEQPVVSHSNEGEMAIITYGTVANEAVKAIEILEVKGIKTRLIRLAALEPLPIQHLRSSLKGVTKALIVEETCEGSGLHEAIAWAVPECDFSHIDLGKKFTPHGSCASLYALNRMDAKAIANRIEEVCTIEN